MHPSPLMIRVTGRTGVSRDPLPDRAEPGGRLAVDVLTPQGDLLGQLVCAGYTLDAGNVTDGRPARLQLDVLDYEVDHRQPMFTTRARAER